jgi:3-hydroxyacyl-[acyl-carrier-protein] dehydratase
MGADDFMADGNAIPIPDLSGSAGLSDGRWRSDHAARMNADFENALQRLPHGRSFRFVDALTSLSPGHDATAIYQVRGGEAFLEGHFPGNPMMPGVILLEAIAQLGGVVAQTDPDVPALGDLRLTGIRAAKILGAAVPGDVLEIRAKVEGRMGGLVQIDGEITVAGQTMATARVTLSGTFS